MLYMSGVELAGKRVLIRQDLNVPVKDGKVASDQRLLASLPTIKRAIEASARVILMSHVGRPTEGEFDERFSLQPVAERLSELLDLPVRLRGDWLDGVDVAEGGVVLCENVRFNIGEKADDDKLARRMAGLCDVFVMDAFGTAHRAQASTHGVAKFAPIACAGPLLAGEIEALSKALDNPTRPMLAIVGGSKVSTKLTVLDNLSTVIDRLIVGGGIANTFMQAAGHVIGNSLTENDLVGEAKRLMAEAKSRDADISIPIDVVVAKEFSESAKPVIKKVDDIADDDMIFDIGPQTAQRFADIIKQVGTIVWNGPVGVFEFDQFSDGTRVLAQAIADSDAFSIAGGGDTLAAIGKFDIGDKVSYISTGGGAFLEFLEGKKLPAVQILEQRSNSS